MSSDSQPSFRFNAKNKLKKVIDPVRKHLISNETYQYIQEKTHNLTHILQNRSIIDIVKNKTRGVISEIRSPPNANQTVSKGFYDSLFTPDTANDVYFQVVVVCLWVIAMLCIIPTIISTLIPSKNFGVKMILFHVFLCEFLYLLYILLSMINVAQNYQLNTILCFIANYGMYVTIPVMYFALLFLSLERIAKRFNPEAAWTKIFTNGYLIQLVLIVLWVAAIGIIAGILLFKFKFDWRSVVGRVSKVAPPLVNDVFNKIVPSSYQCSVDGRLSSIFKILFIVLFVLLIVLIVKSMVISIFYSSFVPSCSRNKKDKKQREDRDISILHAVILFLNLFFSSPFYIISMANSVYTLIKPKEEPFPMTLKISFLLRIISIILQCFTFHIIEKFAWRLLSKILNWATWGRFPVPLNADIALKSSNNNHQSDSASGRRTKKILGNRNVTQTAANDFGVDFSKNTISKKRSRHTRVDAAVSETEISSDDEKVQEPLSTVREKNRSTEETLLEITTPKSTNANGVLKTIPNGKSVSQRITSPATNVRNKNTGYDSIRSTSSDNFPTDDETTNDDDDEPKLAAIIELKQPVTRPPREQYRTKRVQSARPVRVRSRNRHHVRTLARRTKSPRNVNIHVERSKPDRLSKMLEQSHDV